MHNPGLSPVDVILPVFNQPQWTARCISSVLHRTTGIDFRIIAIDDCSTDPAITALLGAFAAEHPERFIVLHNAENLGFVQTVNRGMRFSDRDVVLLNTDTEVPTGWLTHLAVTAHGDKRIASVTPLSTEASIYSVLHTSAEKAYAESVGVEEVAQLIRRISRQRTPPIPTGVGFCLYMKRAALDAVGTFDTTYGRGYGEENDWCMRAARAGWYHVLDDGVFVYHEGHVTMRAIGQLGSTQTTVEAHERLLESRYPEFRGRIDAFVESDTIVPALRRDLQHHCLEDAAAGRRRIAFVLHGALGPSATGGTERHVYDLVEEMRTHCDVLVIHPSEGHLRVHRFVGDLRESWDAPRGHQSAAAVLLSILTALPRDIVHVHHVLDIGFDALTAAHIAGAKVVFSVHDYHALSPHYTLTDARGDFRGVPHPEEYCPGTQEPHSAWQERAHEGLRSIDAIVAPSVAALTLFESVFRDVTCIRHIIPHGIAGPRYTAGGSTEDASTVCMLGYVHEPHKGQHLVASVLRLLAGSGIRCVVIGSTAEAFPGIRSPLVQFLGPYRRDALPDLLTRVRPHIVAILSTYPETFCYTLSEAWQAGVPAYVTPMGALPERIEEAGAGWCAASLDPEEIAHDIIAHLHSRDYPAVRKRAEMLHLPSHSEMAEAYMELYDELCAPPHSSVQDGDKCHEYPDHILNLRHRAMPNLVRSLPDRLADLAFSQLMRWRTGPCARHSIRILFHRSIWSDGGLHVCYSTCPPVA
jgi:GT2 family glycosyltransferase/glycosyltransferase involved in cell wall biosynthesis